MSDNDKAIVLCAVYMILFAVGCLIGGAFGFTIIIFASALLTVILYASWLNERTQRRLGRFIKDSARRAEEEHRR